MHPTIVLLQAYHSIHVCLLTELRNKLYLYYCSDIMFHMSICLYSLRHFDSRYILDDLSGKENNVLI